MRQRPAMTRSPDLHVPARVRLSTPREVVATVPHLLGFHPEHSLVVISLRGARARIGLTMRLDLPAAETASAAADLVTTHLLRDGADSGIVIAYCSSDEWGRGAALQAAAVGETCVTALEACGIAVRDVLVVGRTKFRSVLCPDARCCPPEGAALPDACESPVAAEAVAQGRAVLADRDSVVRVLRPPTGEAIRSMRQALREASEQLDARRAAGERREDVVTESLRLFAAAADRLADPHATLDDRQVARLVAGVHDDQVRDETALGTPGEQGKRMRLLLLTILARVPSPEDVPLSVCLGLLAYVQGDGVLARTALDRALAGDPGCRLAAMLVSALDHAIPPSAIAEARTRNRIRAHRDSLATQGRMRS